MQQRTLTILVSIIIFLSLLAIGVFYLSDPSIRKPTIITGKPTVKKDISRFYPIGEKRVDKTSSSTFRFVASSTKFQESAVDFSGRAIKDYLKLARLTETPIAGATLLKGTSSDDFLYYMDATSGEINLINFNDKVSITIATTKLTDIQDLVWGNSGHHLYFVGRAVRNGRINISSGTILDQAETLQEVAPTNSDNNVTAITVNPDRNKFFFLESVNGKTAVYISKPDLSDKIKVFESPLTEWTAAWASANIITLQTKPSVKSNGYLYFLNPTTKVVKKVIGDLPGLNTLTSPDGNKILINQSQENSFSSFVLDLKYNKITPLSLRALSDKCVWSKNSVSLYCAVPKITPAAEYPDAWYRGEIGFDDSLWTINTNTGETKLLHSPSESLINEEMDAVNLFLDSKEKKLFFTNKKDQTLWMLDLENNY